MVPALCGLYVGQLMSITLALPAVLSPLVGLAIGALVGWFAAVNRERTLAQRTGWGGRQDDLRHIAEQVDHGRAPTADATSRELARRYAADEAELGRFTRRLHGGLLLLVLAPSLVVPTRSSPEHLAVCATVAVLVGVWTAWHGWVVPRRYDRVVAFLDATYPTAAGASGGIGG